MRMKIDPNVKAEFEKTGRVWFRNAISEIDLLILDAAAMLQSKAGQRVKSSPSLDAIFSANSSLMLAIGKLDPDAKPVRVVAFNKSQNTNWGVPWHQDRVIAVADKQDVQGFENWTKKSGTWHCEPPQQILDQILFVRVHLDDTDRTNGAMEILLGSHASGIVPSKRAEVIAHQHPIESCAAKRGDVLVLKMLTLHSSKPSEVQTDRRAFRIDFSSANLPAPLSWAS